MIRMPPPSTSTPVPRRKQTTATTTTTTTNISTLTSSNAYLTVVAVDHLNRNRNNLQPSTRTSNWSKRISTMRSVKWICIGLIFALMMMQLKSYPRLVAVVKTLDMSRIAVVETSPLFYNMSKLKGNDQTKNNDHQVGLPRKQRRRVRFIPFPHKTLGSGTFVQCQWTTGRTLNASSELLDFTQRNAYTEGVCIPPTLKNTLHIFSSAEAIECLSPAVQKRDIRLMLSGDSYMKQLHIGLSDILLSKQISGDKEIRNSFERQKVLLNAEHWMDNRRQNNSSFPFVQYRCEEECYGKKAMERCSECMDDFSGNNRSNDVWVVGFGIHNYNRISFKHQVDKVVDNIYQFLDAEEGKNRTIYVGPPNFFYREDYKDQSANMESVYRGLLPHLAPENPAQPFLDVFELTKSCVMENCTFDGGHRTRFVNRWKAQLLLNTLCEVQV